MPSRKDNPNRNETFGRLLSGAINSIATYEGKTAPVVEEELGAQAIVAGKTIQRYKAGYLPPDPHTIEILAEAAVQRGYLGREWLQRFLRAARYPFADKLLDHLRPIGPARVRPPRVYHNLPAATYSQFVMRKNAFAEVREGLSKQSAITLIVGLGGNGKTSLAREVATRCLQDDGDIHRFDAVVWVSDKDRPGATNLSNVLDEIARTLDYPGFTQFEHDEKRREVENLLRRQRVLIVVDNFETITDGALLAWLQNLSEPSKALITAREYRREFRRGGWLVELRGMIGTEAREFINERLRLLRMERLVTDMIQLEPLIATTGGNPKAIEIALGLVKHERRSLQQVVDDIYAARGELFDDLFTRAWVLLDEAARRVLMVMTFFPTNTSSEALSATANVQGFAFDCVVERLIDLALLDVQQTDLQSMPRYALHPLVRAFAAARLAETRDFEKIARERWVQWFAQLVSSVGFCWDDLSKLSHLDSERETIHTVLTWTFQHHFYAQTAEICRDMRYYWDVRGIWDKLLEFERIIADITHKSKDHVREVEALAAIVEVLSRQDKVVEAAQYVSQLIDLRNVTPLTKFVLILSQQALFLYYRANQNLDAAQKVSRELHARAGQLPRYGAIACCHWLATCLYQQGNLTESRQHLHDGFSDAIKYGYQRSIVFYLRSLAMIDLDQGDLESAQQRLSTGLVKSREYQDRQYTGNIQRLYARLHILRGDLPAAQVALTEAIDLFERLGMRRELAEARAELARLDTGIALGAGHAENSADSDELSPKSSATLVK